MDDEKFIELWEVNKVFDDPKCRYWFRMHVKRWEARYEVDYPIEGFARWIS